MHDPGLTISLNPVAQEQVFDTKSLFSLHSMHWLFAVPKHWLQVLWHVVKLGTQFPGFDNSLYKTMQEHVLI